MCDCVGADHVRRPSDVHFGKARGAYKQRFGGNADAGRDHAADVFSTLRDHVECGRSAEVYDDAGAAIALECRDAVHDAISADFCRIINQHRHPGFHPGFDEQRLGLEVTFADFAKSGIERRHNR